MKDDFDVVFVKGAKDAKDAKRHFQVEWCGSCWLYAG